jgi:hypothetical protein
VGRGRGLGLGGFGGPVTVPAMRRWRLTPHQSKRHRSRGLRQDHPSAGALPPRTLQDRHVPSPGARRTLDVDGRGRRRPAGLMLVRYRPSADGRDLVVIRHAVIDRPIGLSPGVDIFSMWTALAPVPILHAPFAANNVPPASRPLRFAGVICRGGYGTWRGGETIGRAATTVDELRGPGG